MKFPSKNSNKKLPVFEPTVDNLKELMQDGLNFNKEEQCQFTGNNTNETGRQKRSNANLNSLNNDQKLSKFDPKNLILQECNSVSVKQLASYFDTQNKKTIKRKKSTKSLDFGKGSKNRDSFIKCPIKINTIRSKSEENLNKQKNLNQQNKSKSGKISDYESYLKLQKLDDQKNPKIKYLSESLPPKRDKSLSNKKQADLDPILLKPLITVKKLTKYFDQFTSGTNKSSLYYPQPTTQDSDFNSFCKYCDELSDSKPDEIILKSEDHPDFEIEEEEIFECGQKDTENWKDKTAISEYPISEKLNIIKHLKREKNQELKGKRDFNDYDSFLKWSGKTGLNLESQIKEPASDIEFKKLDKQREESVPLIQERSEKANIDSQEDSPINYYDDYLKSHIPNNKPAEQTSNEQLKQEQSDKQIIKELV